jgi:hypothetical protein
MEVTYEQVAQFRYVAQLWLRRSGYQRTKLDYVVEKMVKKTKTIAEQYADRQEDLRDEHAEVDTKTKVIVVNPDGSRAFSPDKIKSLRKALRDLSHEHLEIDPHYVDDESMPKTIEFEYLDSNGDTRVMSEYDVRDAFTNFVIKE